MSVEAIVSKSKTFQELQNEFNQLSFRVGGLNYEIAQKQKDVEAYYKAMRDISIEAAVLREKEAKAEKKEPQVLEEVKNES